MNKLAGSLLIALLTFCLLSWCEVLQFGIAQTSTPVSGTISSDTTWSQANSPFGFIEDVIVPNGVTLTIESGVTVNLNSYSLQVNGTLLAEGNQTSKITMTGSGQNSANWNGRIAFLNGSSNSILKYALITSSPDIIIGIYSTGVTISNCTISGTTDDAVNIDSSSPNLSGNIISNNGANGITIHGMYSSPTITANNISNNGNSGIEANSGSPVISNNNITNNRSGVTTILNIATDLAKISNNLVANNYYGVYLFFTQTTPNNNLVTGNLIINNTEGITIQIGYNFRGTCAVLNNTITENEKGVVVTGGIPSSITINQNNIYGNTQYNAEGGSSIDATENWWGTTDAQAINQTISGNLNFVPFLNSPNSQAPPVPEFPPWIIPPLLFSLVLVSTTVAFMLRRTRRI